MILSGDKLISGIAVLENGTSSIIYEGYDLDLLEYVCRKTFAEGIRCENTWQGVKRIDLIVDDYNGDFSQYEKEMTEKILKRMKKLQSFTEGKRISKG